MQCHRNSNGLDASVDKAS
jgi:hypothetical protein